MAHRGRGLRSSAPVAPHASSSSQARELWDKQVKLASLFVLDALDGRLSNGKAATSLKSRCVQRCFAIQTSTAFTSFVYGCCGLQMRHGHVQSTRSQNGAD